MYQRARQLIPTRRRVVRTAAGLVGALTLAVGSAGPVSAQDAQSVSDDESTRTILLVVGGLVAMGVLLTVVTVWFWRSTRPDHPVLAPLEIMGDRRFVAKSAFEQRQLLDGVRPEGAEVLRTMPADDALADRGEAALDLQRLVVETPTTFDDLAEPALLAEPDVAAPPPTSTPAASPDAEAVPDALTPAAVPVAAPAAVVGSAVGAEVPAEGPSEVPAEVVEAAGSPSDVPPPPPVPADR
jgi:hypothetical protein